MLSLSRAYIITLIVIGFILLTVILFFITKLFLNNKKKVNKPIIDQISIDSIIINLGGIKNIDSASIEGARVSIRVKSVRQCHLDEIKAKGALGIFVTGTTIKMMLPYDSTILVKEINNQLKGENLHDWSKI